MGIRADVMQKRSALRERTYTWQETKQLCGLTDLEVRVAIILGFRPEQLIQSAPTRKEPWKESPALQIWRKYGECVLSGFDQ